MKTPAKTIKDVADKKKASASEKKNKSLLKKVGVRPPESKEFDLGLIRDVIDLDYGLDNFRKLSQTKRSSIMRNVGRKLGFGSSMGKGD